jgi:hypothetical protein
MSEHEDCECANPMLPSGAHYETCSEYRAMSEWTTEKPWKAGWYWRKGPTGYIEVVEIYCERDQCWIRGGTDYNVLSVLGEWAGPIEPPK